MRSPILTAILVVSVGCTSEAPIPGTRTPAGQQQQPLPGLICERTNVNCTIIEERNVNVTDWSIRFTNQSPAPRWIGTVAEKSTSEYLVERNPQQITYRVMTLEGNRWRDSHMGFSTVIGPKDAWLEIPPDDSLEFIVPIFDHFDTNPTEVRLDFRVTSDPNANQSQTFQSAVYTHNAEPTDEREPE